MTGTELGAQPAYPQVVCPRCVGRGTWVEGGQHLGCSVCNGTGYSMTGGMTKREAFAMSNLAGLLASRPHGITPQGGPTFDAHLSPSELEAAISGNLVKAALSLSDTLLDKLAESHG